MPIRHKSDFKQALSTLRQQRDKEDAFHHNQRWIIGIHSNKTVTIMHNSFSFVTVCLSSQSCCVHLTGLPTHSCWLKRAEKSTARLHMYTIEKDFSNMAAERSVEERISEKICEKMVDVRVPRMTEQVIEDSQISSQTRVLESTIEQTFDVPAPEMAEQLVETLKNVSWDRTKQRTVEHIGDIPVPQVFKELAEISGDFSQKEGSSAFCGTNS